jgi:hypothetical protein
MVGKPDPAAWGADRAGDRSICSAGAIDDRQISHSTTTRQASHRDGNAEARIQAAIVEWVRLVAPEVLIFHPANGGWRTAREAARFRWIGLVAGVPDLALVIPGGHIRFIEVKAAAGRLSAEQTAIHSWLTALGCPAAICRSVDDARRALKHWGIKTRESAR